jgi:hypothetical protein
MFSEKGKVEYENYVHSHLDYRSAVSERQTNHINAQPLYHPSLNHAGSYLSIDPEARVSASQLERPFTEHEFAARSAKNKDHFYAEVKDVDIEGVGVLTGYGFDDLGQPQPGYVVPTSYWIGGAETKDQNHLMNVYVIRPDGEPAVIRSSKIDSKEKADEFVNLLILIRDQIRVETGNPDYQLRVTSEQLNSFDLERETSMIKDQHRWLAYANQKMEREGVGELLHLNLPANTFYFISSKLRKSGVAGKVFEKNVFNGEIRSKNQNLDGWGTYLRWVNQDLQVALQDKSLEGLTNPNNESATNFIEGY